mmetsp:Transcript_20046/g.43459  ORF Transcript_20046/g.43459 Transcript_20046/m.43459 type:complete len:455 (-) Transcript_20046:20-1384(-)
MPQDQDDGDTIDGALVEAKVMKSKRNLDCNMCNFADWSPGDTKYIVEHWMLRDERRQGNDWDDSTSTSRSSINWDAPEREHLCPGCAVSRGLDYDTYYVQNKNAAPMQLVTKKRKDETSSSSDNVNSSSSNNKIQRVDGNDVSKPNKSSSANVDKLRLDCMAEQLNNNINISSNKIKACYIRPHPECPLFVAWNGVIVLVYDGFPPSLIMAKEQLSSVGGDDGYGYFPKLKDENFGSKWPKTTMAAVFDNAPDMTVEELTHLKKICQDYGQKIANNNSETTVHANSNAIHIRQLSLVQYECRSLEKLYSRVDISLEENTNSNGLLDLVSQPLDKEKEVVNSVVGEWSSSSLEEYLPKVNQPGSRMNSYRQSLLPMALKGSESTNTAATTTPTNGAGIGGATCVAFLDDPSSSFSRLRQILIEFRIAVDLEFPGRYAWFAEKSLHVTLRSLDTVL